MSHTKGPWELVSLSGYGAPFSVRMAYNSDNPNASKTHYGVQSIRRREDAVLIAAAPDLLEALKAALPHIERLAGFSPTTNGNMGKVLQARKDRDLVVAAIAKAEGCDQ